MTGIFCSADSRSVARQVCIKLRAVLAAGSVTNVVAFDEMSLIIEEQFGGDGGGQNAGLLIVTQ